MAVTADQPLSVRRPLGRMLVESGQLRPATLATALDLCRQTGRPLADVLLHRGWVSRAALGAARARQWGMPPLDLARHPPDPRLLVQVPADLPLTVGLLPLCHAGTATVIAADDPAVFDAWRPVLERRFGPVIGTYAPRDQLVSAALGANGRAVTDLLDTRLDARMSCRSANPRGTRHVALALVAFLAAALLVAPAATAAMLLTALVGWAILTLGAATALKLAAAVAATGTPPRDAGRVQPAMFTKQTPRPHTPGQPPLPLYLRRLDRQGHPPDARHSAGDHRLPVISVMIPLFDEAGIAPRLVARLRRLDYPRELTDIILVTEACDTTTRAALDAAGLPPWMRVVTVPEGPLRTKPRALNHALPHCRGSIVGVWDAEDRPAPDQLSVIARRFSDAPPDVACLQGVLDYYDQRRNWLSRCFAIEYAAWFRVVLPGLARLGLVVPLGGTTLFFRRTQLERLGAWDAHNVTEDADLGLRLARAGYRTELVATITEEEPNARAIPWIRQRSRWLKGYAMTWAVHMRDPVRLWRDLGPRRFIGVQILFLGTLSQFLLAPLLWAGWTAALVPGAADAGPLRAISGLSLAFVAAEVVNALIGIIAVRRAGHRHLLVWVPTLIAYYPLATLAAVKALAEVVTRPFYWDKTAHGIFAEAAEEAAATEPAAAPAGPEAPVVPKHAPGPRAAPGTAPAEDAAAVHAFRTPRPPPLVLVPAMTARRSPPADLGETIVIFRSRRASARQEARARRDAFVPARRGAGHDPGRGLLLLTDPVRRGRALPLRALPLRVPPAFAQPAYAQLASAQPARTRLRMPAE
jgi:hypothetical protein